MSVPLQSDSQWSVVNGQSSMVHGVVMSRVLWGLAVVALLVVALVAPAQEGKLSVKAAKSEPPKELKDAVRKLLPAESIVLMDAQGKTVAEFWFRAAIPADATPEQLKNGVTYREVKQGELFGAVRFEQGYKDYRQQKVKAGVYTLRLGYQPMDGDHSGKSPELDFLVAISAAKDQTAEPLDYKKMVETSASSINTGHPAVFMLFPTKPLESPQLQAKANAHTALATRAEVVVAAKNTGHHLGIAVTVVGHAED